MNTPRAVALSVVSLALGCTSTEGTRVSLPGAGDGIGFHDLGYARTLRKVVVPGGRSGRLDLVDPVTLEVTSIAGFSAADVYDGTHDNGVTSAVEVTTVTNDGATKVTLFAIDRTSTEVAVVDWDSKRIVTKAPLEAVPGYVRYVASRSELWITEPNAGQIEVITADFSSSPPTLAAAGKLLLPGGPEGLAIDDKRQLAYTHEYTGWTLAIDLGTRQVAWQSDIGCEDPRGIALDAARGWVFSACGEGKVVVLDAQTGTVLSDLAEGVGLEVIGYSDRLAHLYVAGGVSETLGVVSVGRAGELTLLGNADTVLNASSVVADEQGHAWVSDPERGGLLRFTDDYPAGAQ